jgi:methyltransferase (TIGR00027 family)
MSDALALPARPNLEQQRKRARALLKAARADDPNAMRRFRAALSTQAAVQPTLSLSAAQLVIAREYGFATWAKLKGYIEACQLSPLGSLALVDAANRALETERADALFRDPFARALTGDTGMALFGEVRPAWGTPAGPLPAMQPQPYLSIRTRFFDEKLQSAVRAASLTQVVVLGAGMDARAFRLAWPASLAWFEIDTEEVLGRKERVLRRLPPPHCTRRVVCADLAADWLTPLLAAGFDSSRPAAFLIEGVLLHLSPDTALHVLGVLRAAATLGSWIGLDVMSCMTVASPLMSAHLKRLAELGWPTWLFASDEPEALLTNHGWSASSVIAGSPQASYGRWPFGYTPRGTASPGVARAFFVDGSRGGDA